MCAFMAASLAGARETDTDTSATDGLGQTAISFWSHGLVFT